MFYLATRVVLSFQDVSPNGTCESSESTSSKEIQGEINYPDGKVRSDLLF